MVKALLSGRGIEFDALDVANDPAALRALRELGLSTVPVVAVGDRYVAGWNPTKLAELVGFAHQERVVPAAELLHSLRLLLDATLRAARQVPDDRWEMRAPGRDRPLRELIRHTFHVIEAGVDADVLGVFPAAEWLTDKDVPWLTGAERLGRYGAAVRAKLDVWYATPATVDVARTIDADVGPRSLAQVLERTRLHAGQHLRQIYWFLDESGVAPDDPLTDERLRALGFDLPPNLF